MDATPPDFWSAFWPNFWSSLTAALIMGAFPLVWALLTSKVFVRWRTRGSSPEASPDTTPIKPTTLDPGSSGPTDHSVRTGRAGRDNNVQVIDNRHYETHLIQELIERESAARPATSSDSEWPMIAMAVAGALVIAVLYVLFPIVFLASAIVMCVSIVLLTFYVKKKSMALFGSWPEGSVQVVTSVVVVVLGTVTVAVLLAVTERDGISLVTLQQAVSAQIGAIDGGHSNPIALLKTAVTTISTFGLPGWYFLGGQTFAVLFVFEAQLLALSKVIDWNLVVRLTKRTTDNRRALRRARALRDGKWPGLLVVVTASAMGIFVGSQWLFDHMPNANSLIPSP